MCIILDADCFGKYLDTNDKDMRPIRTWLKSKNENAKIAHSSTEKLKTELEHSSRMVSEFVELRRENKLKVISSEDVNDKENELNEMKNEIKSDDIHILALALAGNVKLLASLDKNLGKDFKKICKGKIYKNCGHKHLLDECKCK